MLQRAESFMAQGVQKYERFEYSVARTKFVLAYHEYQSFNEKQGVVRSCLNLARVALDLGELEEAEKQLQRARKIIDEYQLTQLAVYCDIIASSLLIREEQYDQAEKLLAPYLADNNELVPKEISEVAVAIIQNRTRIAFGKGEDERKWLERYRKAVADMEKYRPRLLRFEAAQALQDEGAEKALELLEEALELYRLHSDPKGVAYTSLEVADIEDDASMYEEAIEDYQRGLSAGFRIRDRRVVISALEGLIRLYGKLESKEELKPMVNLLDEIVQAGKEKPWYLLRIE